VGKDKNESGAKKERKIFDTAAGIISLFFENDEAKNKNADKVFKELIYGLLAGIVIFILMVMIVMNF
jgi:hypothetical protein